MDSNKFKDIAASIQSVFVSLAILSGGVWAMVTLAPYWETKQLTEKLRPSILITMTVEQKHLPGNISSSKVILVEVSTENTGGRIVEYDFPGKILQFTQQIPVNEKNTYRNGKVYNAKYMGEDVPPDYGRLAPGGKITYQFAALVDDPGLYSVFFRALPAGSKDEKSFYYGARKLVVVN